MLELELVEPGIVVDELDPNELSRLPLGLVQEVRVGHGGKGGERSREVGGDESADVVLLELNPRVLQLRTISAKFAERRESEERTTEWIAMKSSEASSPATIVIDSAPPGCAFRNGVPS